MKTCHVCGLCCFCPNHDFCITSWGVLSHCRYSPAIIIFLGSGVVGVVQIILEIIVFLYLQRVNISTALKHLLSYFFLLFFWSVWVSRIDVLQYKWLWRKGFWAKFTAPFCIVDMCEQRLDQIIPASTEIEGNFNEIYEIIAYPSCCFLYSASPKGVGFSILFFSRESRLWDQEFSVKFPWILTFHCRLSYHQSLRV